MFATESQKRFLIPLALLSLDHGAPLADDRIPEDLLLAGRCQRTVPTDLLISEHLASVVGKASSRRLEPDRRRYGQLPLLLVVNVGLFKLFGVAQQTLVANRLRHETAMLLCLEHATVHRSLWGTKLDLFEKLVPGERRHHVLLYGLRESGGCVLLKESSKL